MERIAQFQKVSAEQFIKDWTDSFNVSEQEALTVYNGLKLPHRATAGSAGYDFFAPICFTLAPRESIKIPTGIRTRIEPGWVLMMFPRSGLGFKYRLQLNNTVGIVDSDYFGADNEGHIFVKLINDSNEAKSLTVPAGEAFSQGVFLPFGITEDDEAAVKRTGGFGSTTKR